MFLYTLLLCSILISTLNGCVLQSFANRDIKNTGDILFFNGGASIIWILALLAFSIISNDLVISFGSIVYGAIYGVIICAFLLFKNLAITSGPVSLTQLIGSCTFIITTLFSVFVMKQGIDIYQISGIVMILVALFLCVGKQEGEKKLSVKWLFYCIMLFLAGGGVGIIYMLFGASDVSNEINGMMLCASVVATVLYFLSGLIINRVKSDPKPCIYKSGIVFLLLTGGLSVTYMRLNLYLSAVIPSVVFFPVFNGSIVILSSVVGWIVYRETLSKKQIVGMVLGIFALIMTGSGSFLAELILKG